MKNRFSVNCIFLLVGTLTFTAPVSAATASPASKCVTVKTKATHASVTAQMEKDIAPFTKTASAAAVIEKYRQSMATAWEAMQEPYCGFGPYGTASAVKSYSKSVVRARTAFLTGVKNKPTTVVPAVAKSTPAPPPTPAPISTPKPIVSSTTRLRGLHRGMQSPAVLQLQQLLNRHLGSKADVSILTGFFGPKTEKMLIQFQIEKKLITDETSPGAGTVGPKTAAALGKI